MKAAIIGIVVMLAVLGALFVLTQEPSSAPVEETPAATEQSSGSAFKL